MQKYLELIKKYNFDPKFFLSFDGTKIAYHQFNVKNNEKAIVILTGKKEFAEKYVEIIDNFVKKDFAVYLMEWRGQGNSEKLLSDKNLFHSNNTDDFKNDLNHFIKNVIKEHNHQEMYAYAHSMGGAVLSLFAIENPQVFKKLILTAPMYAIKGLNYKLAYYLLKIPFILGLKNYNIRQLKEEYYTSCPSGLEYVKYVDSKNKEKENFCDSIGALYNIFYLVKEINNKIHSMKTPTLIFWAGKDIVVDTEFSKKLTEKNKIIKMIDVFGEHEFYLEGDEVKNKLFSDIDSFLN